jgi:hypothetical protein
MSEYSEYFLNSKASIAQLELIEISHESFSQTWRLVRNATRGVTVDHDSEETGVEYVYCPMRLELSGPKDDLDQTLRVTIGDVGEIIAKEIALVIADDTGDEYPTLKYRIYRSDVLTAPLFGPLNLQIKKVNMSPEGSQFEARAPSLNNNRTGELYSIARFPMLRGLL